MKKFLAMVMALCMVCMTVVVASATEPTSSVSGIKGATVNNDGHHVSEANLTPEQKDALKTKVNPGSYDQILYGDLNLSGDTDATIHLTTTPSRLRDTEAYYLDANGDWQKAPCSRNGNDVTINFPAGYTGPFSIVQRCNAPSSGTSGADVKAPQTSDMSVELVLAAGMLLFGTIAVVARKRHAA